MFNSLRSIIKSHRPYLIGSIVAALILALVVLVPIIGTSVTAGLFLTPGLGGLLYAVPPVLLGFTALLFASFVTIVFYLLRIRHSALIAGVSLPVGYILLTTLNKILNIPLYQKAILFGVIAFMLVYGLMLASKKLRINTVVSVILFIVFVGTSVYSAQLIEQTISKRQAPAAQMAYQAKKNQEFETARQGLRLTAYYPSYISTEFPVSEPELNGYSQESYSHINPHVTYTLGGAQVTQAALVKNQDKLMDFTRNCDIINVASSMISESEVSQGVINKSLDNLSRCKVIHQTPAGTNVYAIGRKDFMTFYLQIDKTNIVIKFSGSRAHKYSNTLLPQLNKVIDSLQPITSDKLQRGDERRASTY